MTIINNTIAINNQNANTGIKKTGVFSSFGKKFKVTLSAIKQRISNNKQSKTQNKNIQSRKVTTVEKHDNKNKVGKKENNNKPLADITIGFLNEINSSTNKKEFKNVLREINVAYILNSSIPETDYQEIQKQVTEKLKTFNK